MEYLSKRFTFICHRKDLTPEDIKEHERMLVEEGKAQEGWDANGSSVVESHDTNWMGYTFPDHPIVPRSTMIDKLPCGEDFIFPKINSGRGSLVEKLPPGNVCYNTFEEIRAMIKEKRNVVYSGGPNSSKPPEFRNLTLTLPAADYPGQKITITNISASPLTISPAVEVPRRMSKFAEDLIGVQPMKGPPGLVFTLRALFADPKMKARIAYDRAMKVVHD